MPAPIYKQRKPPQLDRLQAERARHHAPFGYQRCSPAETAAGHDDPPGEQLPRPEAGRNAAWTMGAARARRRRRGPAGPAAPAKSAAVRRRWPAPSERRGTQVPPRRQSLQVVVVGAESAGACAVPPRPAAPGVGRELLLRGGHRGLPRVHQGQVVLLSREWW